MAIQQKLSLMIPGPTPVPEKVLQALSKHPIGHRSKEFQDLVESTTKNLQWLHQTKNDVLTITGSGTAAMEAGIIVIGFVGEVLLKEIFSKETIVHISKFCVMSRSRPEFAKEIPNACESSLSKPTE